MAGAALLGAGILIAPAAAPPPLVETVHVPVQLDQFVPGAILAQIVTNQIENATILAQATFTGTVDIVTGLINGPVTFITQLLGGTPFLTAFGDGLAQIIVGFLDGIGAVTNPAFFIGLRALNSTVAAAQASIFLGLETFNAGTDVLGGFVLGTVDALNQLAMLNIAGAVTAFVDGVISGFVTGGATFSAALTSWQSAILTALEQPLPPGVTMPAATPLSVPAAKTVSSPTTNDVASVPSPPTRILTALTANAPVRADVTAPTTGVGGPRSNGVGKAVSNDVGKAVSNDVGKAVSNDLKAAAAGFGHLTGGKK